MTETQTRIVQLFKALPPTEQRALVEHLAETAQSGSFYDRLSPRERAQLDESIAQAERGETVPEEAPERCHLFAKSSQHVVVPGSAMAANTAAHSERARLRALRGRDGRRSRTSCCASGCNGEEPEPTQAKAPRSLV